MKNTKTNRNGLQHSLDVHVPSHWEFVPLEMVLDDIVGGGTPSKANSSYWEGSIPWLTVKDMRTHRPADAIDHITDAAARESSTNVIPADTVIIATRIGLGKVIRVPYDAAINQDLKALINKPEIDKGYLEYWIISIADYLESIGSGTTVKGIRLEQLRSLPFPLAPLEQQKRIVAEIEKQFSRLDEAVANLKRVKANLKRYKAAVLKAAVEGKLTEEWRKQHPSVEPAFKLLERILAERRQKWEEAELAQMNAKGKTPKDDKWKKKYKEPNGPELNGLPNIPEAWGWATLPQLGELNRGKSKHRPRNDPKLYGGPYPFVQTGDIRHASGVITEYTQTYSEEGLRQSRLWPVGTLCITIAANIADTAILGFEACFPDSVVGFISETENVETKYVEYFIRTAKEDLDRFAPATAQKNINLAILGEVAVPLMSIEEQRLIVHEIESRLSIATRIEETIEINLHRNERLRQTILTKAFSGELVGPEPGDGSASELLSQITSHREREKKSKPTRIRGIRAMKEEINLTLEEVEDDHLSKLLENNGGSLSPKNLWEKSKLTIDDFYAQLKKEIEKERIEESKDKTELKLVA